MTILVGPKSDFFGWADVEEMATNFHLKPEERTALEGANILFASYGGGGYDGSAFVLFEKEGKLFEVGAGHCSCYGLEGMWDPEETCWEEIVAMPDRLKHLDHGADAEAAFAKLLEQHKDEK